MNINELASKYANTHGGDIVPPCTGLTSDALSEVLKPMMVENSDTGVSTRNALSATHPPLHSTFQTDNSHWYALRTTYGREKKAYDYIISKGGTAFYPTLSTVKLVDGKRKTVEESRIIIRKTKCFDFWERNVLFPKTKRSFFRTPTLPFSA